MLDHAGVTDHLLKVKGKGLSDKPTVGWQMQPQDGPKLSLGGRREENRSQTWVLLPRDDVPPTSPPCPRTERLQGAQDK